MSKSYEAFEKLLKQKGVTATDVSRETGIPRSNFTDWKKERSTPRAENLQKIANYFGVPVETFTGGKYPSSLFFSRPAYAQPVYDVRKARDDILKALENFPSEPEGTPVYYQNEEVARLAQEMLEDKDMRALFHMKQGMSKEKFAAHMNMMKELYRLEHPEEHPEDFE